MKPMKNRIIRSIANDSQLGWVDLRRETLDEIGAAGAAG